MLLTPFLSGDMLNNMEEIELNFQTENSLEVELDLNHIFFILSNGKV